MYAVGESSISLVIFFKVLTSTSSRDHGSVSWPLFLLTENFIPTFLRGWSNCQIGANFKFQTLNYYLSSHSCIQHTSIKRQTVTDVYQSKSLIYNLSLSKEFYCFVFFNWLNAKIWCRLQTDIYSAFVLVAICLFSMRLASESPQCKDM